MKKQFIIITLLLFPLMMITAKGLQDNEIYYIPQAGTTNTYLLQTGEYTKELFQVISTYKDEVDITIEQTDNVVSSNPEEFLFINTNNNHQTYPFRILYETHHRQGYIENWETLEEEITDIGNPPVIYARPTNITLGGAWRYPYYDSSTKHWVNYRYYIGYFYLDITPAGYDDPILEPGEYSATLKITAIKGNVCLFSNYITIKASYLLDSDSHGSKIDYSFFIDAQPQSYSINLKTDTAQPVEISKISFRSTELSSFKKNYSNDYFQLVISPNSTYSQATEFANYVFKKKDSEGNALTPYNSKSYSVSLTHKNSKKTFSTNNPIVINIPWETHNKSVNTRGTQKYINEFEYDATVSIELGTEGNEQITAGQYLSTLYYYIICNY